MRRLVIEGWRFLPHSYSLVNQFQCLELLSRPDLTVHHRDVPFHMKSWRQVSGLLSPEREALLAAMAPPPADLRPDAVFRIAFPYEFRPTTEARTAVFGTTELGSVHPVMIADSRPVKEALTAGSSLIVTPSEWSREGFLRSGAPAARLAVVPHGADVETFRPVAEEQRAAFRRSLGWEGRFVALHVGAMSWNKGMDVLLKAFAQFASEHDDALLALKGSDALFSSDKNLRKTLDGLTNQQRNRLSQRLIYIGDTMRLTDIARLHQAADVYVAPYRGEGFNLPVLEAAACGLPVICTKGGPTDAFTRPAFAHRISSRTVVEKDTGDWLLEPDPEHLLALMRQVHKNEEWRRGAAAAGPEFVRANFTWKHAVDRLLEVLFPA